MTTLYGVSGSRAIRSIWAIEEVGIDYEHVPTHFFNDSKTEDYLAINPNGRIPTLQDDGPDGPITLCESMAINLYLAKHYGGDLYPATAADEALAWQWSVWAISEIEPLQMQIVVQKLFTPEEKRNPKVIAGAEKGLRRPLGVLDAHLAKRDWLLGDAFTVADLNVAAVMLLFDMIELDTSDFSGVSRWRSTCGARPALARAQAKA
ncbi:MAG: glutathione S-transferase family protein [Pseudomonadota bacterium]